MLSLSIISFLEDINIGYIYVIENNINHKKYVGQTINPTHRWKTHKNDDVKNNNCILGHAFNKYGIDNFSFNIIEECENEKMSEREIYWIKKLNTCVKDENSWGYNITHGGESLYGKENPFYGKHHSEETKSKLSEIRKMFYSNPESNPFYGKHHSKETKEKISKANSGNKWTEEMKKRCSENRIGENNNFYGKHHSEETKKKLSESHKGKIPYNAKKWIAYNENQEIEFLSIGKIMNWLKENLYINADEHFTTSMLKNNLRKSENKNIKFMGYYWKKSVETIENIDDKSQEVSRVGSEIDTESKCEDIAY